VATPLNERELDAIREDADRFIAELDEEAYLHFAGHKETYDLVPIYERHAALTKLDTALAVGASVNGGRNVRELWRFACEGYLGNFVSEEEEKIAEAETKSVKVGDSFFRPGKVTIGRGTKVTWNWGGVLLHKRDRQERSGQVPLQDVRAQAGSVTRSPARAST